MLISEKPQLKIQKPHTKGFLKQNNEIFPIDSSYSVWVKLTTNLINMLRWQKTCTWLLFLLITCSQAGWPEMRYLVIYLFYNMNCSVVTNFFVKQLAKNKEWILFQQINEVQVLSHALRWGSLSNQSSRTNQSKFQSVDERWKAFKIIEIAFHFWIN